MTRDEAKQHALRYVRFKLVHGETREGMRREIFMGFGSPSEPGYELTRGRMSVPGTTGPKPRHTFNTDDLVAEIEAGAKPTQGELFGETA